MCRSIKTLRPPYTEHPTSEDSRAAALQYVRKVAGMRSPSKANTEAFEAAVAADRPDHRPPAGQPGAAGPPGRRLPRPS